MQIVRKDVPVEIEKVRIYFVYFSTFIDFQIALKCRLLREMYWLKLKRLALAFDLLKYIQQSNVLYGQAVKDGLIPL